MNRPAVEPLAEDIAQLFAAERRAPRPSALREAGVFARLQPLVGVTAAVATGVGVAAGTSAAAGTTTAPAVGGGVTTGAATGVGTVALPASKALIAGVALLVGGAGLGTSAYLTLRDDARKGVTSGPTREAAARTAVSPRPAPVVEPLEPSASAEPAEALPASPPITAPRPPAAPMGVAAGPTRPLAGVGSPPARSPASATGLRTRSPGPSARASASAVERRADMAAESILLEGARRALGRGAVDAALVDLDKHARTYPEGYLTEEREVLSVRALALAGRRESAERRAAAFRRTFPRSIQLEALARALDAKP